ncbi:hypothetical protein [Capnocytophaga bilenii]
MLAKVDKITAYTTLKQPFCPLRRPLWTLGREEHKTKAYQKIPEVLSFTDANGNDTTTAKEQVEANYRQIKLDVIEIIEREKERITNDPELRHLVEKEGEYS